MEEYYKKQIKIDKKDINFQIIEWYACDEQEDEENQDDETELNEKYTVRCFGITDTDYSITCKITDFTPFYYIKVPDNFNNIKLRHLIKYVKEAFQMKKKINDVWCEYYSKCIIESKCSIIEKKDLFGFRNGKLYKYIRLVFDNFTALNKSKYIFKNAIIINNINDKAMKYKLYESNFEPFMRFCHMKDIKMAGWIKLVKEKYKYTYDEANTQLQVSINWKDIQPLNDKQDIANYLQASWDIETYSFDGSFPDPKRMVKNNSVDIMNIYPNVIYQIGTTFKHYKDKNILVKHIFTLKKCDKIENVIVEECKSEKDLLIRWCDLIYNMDPDIMYTYNGDQFDCRYLIERAKLYNLGDYILSRLSRLTNIKTVVKKETFSSSAYGDSDFIRFYIPGRLNYDLLIHYKRGMKKYPSYKLNYIAGQVLNESKNDISAKQIFEYYKNGKSDQISDIARYCVQDTALLQNLVDKQLILITIIQLANVTFVPIGFLTTRGQTIKVYSQLLRKARQMNFLVPHTNFNEDSYSVLIKTKEEHNYDLSDINNYIEIDLGTSQLKGSSGYQIKKINGKIVEIIDESTLALNINIELPSDKNYFNLKAKYQNQEFYISRLTIDDEAVDSSFTGATVLTAVPGCYRDNICVLDFSSLYPSIQMSRNICYSTLILLDEYMPKSKEVGIFKENGITYERFKWDDKIEYTLNHTCECIMKTGKNVGNKCGKPAFFEITPKYTIECLINEINRLKENLTDLNDKKDITSCKTKIKKKDKDLIEFKKDNKNIEQVKYYCRTHDTVKNSRPEEEKFQKKDVSYDFVITQCSINENGEEINKGVVPSLLEELYAERKKVKKLMAKAYEEGNTLLEEIYNSSQLAIKISLNSVYGFVSRNRGNLIMKSLGQITTYTGRTLIEQSKNYAEQEFADYIKTNNLLTQKIEFKQDIVDSINENEKEIILEQFQIQEAPKKKKVINSSKILIL